MKIVLYVLLLAAVTIPLGFLLNRQVRRFEAKQERDPERVRRVRERSDQREAEQEAEGAPHLPELEQHQAVTRFRSVAEQWGWQQVTVEAQPHEYGTHPDHGTRRSNDGPLADVIARHPREPAELRWRFEYDVAGTNPYLDANRFGQSEPDTPQWRPRSASLWLLGYPQGYDGTVDDNPERLLQRFCHSIPAELWAEQAETFEEMTTYEDPDRLAKLADCRRRAGTATPRPDR